VAAAFAAASTRAAPAHVGQGFVFWFSHLIISFCFFQGANSGLHQTQREISLPFAVGLLLRIGYLSSQLQHW
jgi:hypothetical protein